MAGYFRNQWQKSSEYAKGASDPSYGLDYIPYMLHNVETRRKRFQNKSNFFLYMIISLSILFVIIVVVFAYFLLDDTALGKYKNIKDLKQSADTFRTTMADLYKHSSVYYFTDHLYVEFSAIKEYDTSQLSANGKIVASVIKQSIDEYNGDINSINNIMNEQLSRLQNNETDSAFRMLMENLLSSINDYQIANKSFYEISDRDKELKSFIDKADADLSKPENVQNELIKRLILSAVVVTFLITILRYFRNLYQNHYNEMLKSENQDLLIRKFYVTLKSSENNPEERKIVLANFLSDIQPAEPDKKNIEKSPKIKNDTLKEIVDALIKKV